jgi:hypothetical protein
VQTKYSITKIKLLAIVETLQGNLRNAVGPNNKSLYRPQKSYPRHLKFNL